MTTMTLTGECLGWTQMGLHAVKLMSFTDNSAMCVSLFLLNNRITSSMHRKKNTLYICFREYFLMPPFISIMFEWVIYT